MSSLVHSFIPNVVKHFKASVIVFPGQGSQHVGMVKHLTAKGRSLFDMANEILNYNLLTLCTDGPEDDLNKTIHSQPAVFVSSLAAVERLASLSSCAVENCVATAGFSVGEFAALVFAQSIDFVDALRLIKIRAEITQECCEMVPSGMMSILFGNDAKIKTACQLAREYCIRTGIDQDEAVCEISNYLFPHGKIIAGHQTALNFIENQKADFGIKRAKRLPVSGAFHTKLMRPARSVLRNAVSKIKINEPKIPVYSNITGKPYTNANQIIAFIEKQVYLPVRWEQTVHTLYEDEAFREDLPVTFECGPQNQLTTILALVNKTAREKAYTINP